MLNVMDIIIVFLKAQTFISNVRNNKVVIYFCELSAIKMDANQGVFTPKIEYS